MIIYTLANKTGHIIRLQMRAPGNLDRLLEAEHFYGHLLADPSEYQVIRTDFP